MTDRELLELAAKASGLELGSLDGRLTIRRDGYLQYWDPLTDDGDALRLAVMRRLTISFVGDAFIQTGDKSGGIKTEYVHQDQDPAQITRRAIVWSAAMGGA